MGISFKVTIGIIVAIAFVSGVLAFAFFSPTDSKIIDQITFSCTGNAQCIFGFVIKVIDGNTIDVDGNLIRFALASTSELNESERLEAKQFVEQICPVGSQALVDEDDLQTEGSQGRMVAVVYCNGVNLNETVLEQGHAQLSLDFCNTSEFANEAWAQKYGC